MPKKTSWYYSQCQLKKYSIYKARKMLNLKFKYKLDGYDDITLYKIGDSIPELTMAVSAKNKK